MPYCSNCGTSINNNIKFCPNCGTKMENISQKTEQSSKNKMEKGVVKSLKKEVTDTVTSRLKSTISKNPLKESIFDDSSSEIKDNNPTSGIKKSFKKLIIIYLLISIFLLILGQKSDEIIGVQYFSIFILVAYGIRHKKEKPFNWFLKIILILQLILIFSVFMTSYKYFFSSFFSLLAGLSILGLFIVNILLLFKGNKI
jgi:uncharacterized Zn finger protein (UPF0148 family)